MRGETGDGGVAHGASLVAFAEAVMGRDAAEIAATRDALAQAIGQQGVLDAAGVIAMFNVVDRIADATGIPVDEGPFKEVRYAVGGELGMAHLARDSAGR